MSSSNTNNLIVLGVLGVLRSPESLEELIVKSPPLNPQSMTFRNAWCSGMITDIYNVIALDNDNGNAYSQPEKSQPTVSATDNDYMMI